jgi:hypothetical protein
VPEHPDEFEAALRTWSAQEQIVENARAMSTLLYLDPGLVEDLEAACLDDDTGLVRDGVNRFLGDVALELEARST